MNGRYRNYGSDAVKVWLILIIGAVTSPIWGSFLFYLISSPLEMVLNYIEFGRSIFGFEDGSAAVMLWLISPLFILSFIIFLFIKILETSDRKKSTNNRMIFKRNK